MDTRVIRYFDLTLFASMVLLVAFGLAMVYSATYETQGAGINPLVYRQAAYAVVGLMLFVALSGLDYHVLSNLAWPAYLGCCGLLGVVLVTGRALHGAQRWIQLGPWQFQPSEFMKLCVVLALSRYFSRHVEDVRSVRTVVVSLIIPTVPAVLVLLQPDIGTATVYFVLWLALMFAAGVPIWYFLGLVAAAAAAAPVAWLKMQPYQRDRILIFLDPQSDPLNTGYNAIQALISVGAGGFFGRGFLSGSQSQLHFLRVQYADFIFSVLAEELGFVGASALLVLFVIVFIRGFRAAYVSRETFGRLLASGVVVTLAYESIVNVAMNVGLLPITGIPLPMISFGGSSLVTFMGSLGILESIVMRHRKFGF
jgi:rod shape determining protein RodA